MDIEPRRVRWLWEDRIAMGTMALVAGPEGLGKSMLGYWMAAQITRGMLPGEMFGRPKGVLIAATEDSWSHTIVPRLMATGADLARVFRVEVITLDHLTTPVTLPGDVAGVRRAAKEVDAALLLLDPLTSRLDGKLDTHRDAETRQALEPLARLADEAQLAVVGVIHHNKSGSTDPLQLVMASKAFTAVARSVHTVIRDPDDHADGGRLFGTTKNNLGRADLPVLRFQIDGFDIDTVDGIARTGRLRWDGVVAGTISDAIQRNAAPEKQGSVTADAGVWLSNYLAGVGGRAPSAEVKSAGRAAGYGDHRLKRALNVQGIVVENVGYPRTTWWCIPQRDDGVSWARSENPVGGALLTAPTAPLSNPTTPVGSRSTQSERSVRSEQLGQSERMRLMPIDPILRWLNTPIDESDDPSWEEFAPTWGGDSLRVVWDLQISCA